jgi:hypothetical protein
MNRSQVCSYLTWWRIVLLAARLFVITSRRRCVILVGMQSAPAPFPRIPAATTLDEVVDAIESVIRWSAAWS